MVCFAKFVDWLDIFQYQSQSATSRPSYTCRDNKLQGPNCTQDNKLQLYSSNPTPNKASTVYGGALATVAKVAARTGGTEIEP